MSEREHDSTLLVSTPRNRIRAHSGKLCVWLWVVGLLLIVVLPVSQVLAQADEAVPVDVSGILAGLGDDDYAVRQDVTHGLLSDDALLQNDFDRLYAASETPEQRHRLLRVARHHMIRRMIEDRFGDQAGPGSMGLSHHVVRVTGPDQATERAGVMVVMTLPGFPAFAVLEPGDVIVDFAGQPISERISPVQFQKLIQTHQAGEQIELTVMRNGKPVTVPFMLCQGQALGDVYDTKGITLKDPYRQSWRVERSRMDGLLVHDVEADKGLANPAAPPVE